MLLIKSTVLTCKLPLHLCQKLVVFPERIGTFTRRVTHAQKKPRLDRQRQRKGTRERLLFLAMLFSNGHEEATIAAWCKVIFREQK